MPLRVDKLLLLSSSVVWEKKNEKTQLALRVYGYELLPVFLFEMLKLWHLSFIISTLSLLIS